MIIRPARATDRPIIKQIIREADINPLNLDWRHFLIAEENDAIIGIGQVKQHNDGSRELASIATIPARQKQGIARALIEALIARETGTLYLTCREQLESFYTRFGFRKIPRDAPDVPPYFRRLIRIVNLIAPVLRGVRIIVMKREL